MCSWQTASKNCKILKRKQLNQQIQSLAREEESVGGGNRKFIKFLKDFQKFKKLEKNLIYKLFHRIVKKFFKGSSCIVKSKRPCLWSVKMTCSSEERKTFHAEFTQTSDYMDVKQWGTSITRKHLRLREVKKVNQSPHCFLLLIAFHYLQSKGLLVGKPSFLKLPQKDSGKWKTDSALGQKKENRSRRDTEQIWGEMKA